MFDPVTLSAAVATASTAFNGIKRAFQAGRDLESMSQDLSRWMGAVSDVDAAHKSAKNPTMFRKVFSGGSKTFNIVLKENTNCVIDPESDTAVITITPIGEQFTVSLSGSTGTLEEGSTSRVQVIRTPNSGVD